MRFLPAIPTNKILNGSPIASLEFRGPQADDHRRFDVLQIRKTELGPLQLLKHSYFHDVNLALVFIHVGAEFDVMSHMVLQSFRIN